LNTDPEKNPSTSDETVVSSHGKSAARAGSACLVVIRGDALGARLSLDRAELRIGRDPASDLHLPHSNISRQHCAITRHGDLFWLRDLASTNGTYLNDEMIERVPLRDGDQIRVGTTVLKFIDAGNIEADYHRTLRDSAMRDGLTGLFNRNHAIYVIEDLLARKVPLCLAIVDIDHFKRINDRHGHLAGDGALSRIASLMNEWAREHDVIARLGGEEFVLVLPAQTEEHALTRCEALRARIEADTFEGDEVGPLQMTVSIGLTRSSDQIRFASDLLRQADQALYRAKNQGRNRVCRS